MMEELNQDYEKDRIREQREEILKKELDWNNILLQMQAFKQKIDEIEDMAEATRRLLQKIELEIERLETSDESYKLADKLDEVSARLRICRCQHEEAVTNAQEQAARIEAARPKRKAWHGMTRSQEKAIRIAQGR